MISRASRKPSGFLTAGLIVCLACLLLVAACSEKPASPAARHHYEPARFYRAPGSPDDPWGPYIREAAGRFGMPESWVRLIMRRASDGQVDRRSSSGAIGLMQIMPDAYEGLKKANKLGDDPFDPRSNLLAGTAWMRDMYDRYGSPGFLVAYRAGPDRVNLFLKKGVMLPVDALNFVGSVEPALGDDLPGATPGAPPVRRAVREPPVAGCHPESVIDPDTPCAPDRAAAETAAAPDAAGTAAGGCDQAAGEDGAQTCKPAAAPHFPVLAQNLAEPPRGVAAPPAATLSPAPPAGPLADPVAVPAAVPAADPVPAIPAAADPVSEPAANMPPPAVSPIPAGSAEAPKGHPSGQWAIQVGAFDSRVLARSAAKKARDLAADLLRTATIETPAAPRSRMIRARLTGISRATATDACVRLSGHHVTCYAVSPERANL